jgi:hypothetical protein
MQDRRRVRFGEEGNVQWQLMDRWKSERKGTDNLINYK